jgi:hypothetical protein
MVSGIELQVKVRARIKATAVGEALLFGFTLGPLHIFIIAGLPTDEDVTPLVYVKLSLKPTGEWELFREHTPPAPRMAAKRAG